MKVNSKIDIYNSQEKEILLFEDGIQVKGQKDQRESPARLAKEDTVQAPLKSKTPTVTTDIVMWQKATGEFEQEMTRGRGDTGTRSVKCSEAASGCGASRGHTPPLKAFLSVAPLQVEISFSICNVTASPRLPVSASSSIQYIAAPINEVGEDLFSLTSVVKAKLMQEYGRETTPLNLVAITDGARVIPHLTFHAKS